MSGWSRGWGEVAFSWVEGERCTRHMMGQPTKRQKDAKVGMRSMRRAKIVASSASAPLLRKGYAIHTAVGLAVFLQPDI